MLHSAFQSKNVQVVMFRFILNGTLFFELEAKGKIVVYNQKWIDYSTTVNYRTQGASKAAKAGALASLVHSVTPFSINSPHTGQQVIIPKRKISFLVYCYITACLIHFS